MIFHALILLLPEEAVQTSLEGPGRCYNIETNVIVILAYFT